MNDNPEYEEQLNWDDLEYLQRMDDDTGEISLPPKPPKPTVHSTDPRLLTELMSTDEALWERAWFEFNERYKYYIYFVAIETGGQPDAAQELVNAVLLKVQKNIGSYNQHKGKFRSWLWKITHNLMVDELRKIRRAQNNLESLQARQVSSQVRDDIIANILDNNDDESSFAGLTEQALDRMAATFRGKQENIEVFRKFAVEFLPAEEVAREFNITQNRVWSVKNQLMPKFTRALQSILHEKGRL